MCLCVVQGYQGMVDGGDNIKEATWESVSSMLQMVSVMRSIWPLRAMRAGVATLRFLHGPVAVPSHVCSAYEFV